MLLMQNPTMELELGFPVKDGAVEVYFYFNFHFRRKMVTLCYIAEPFTLLDPTNSFS